MTGYQEILTDPSYSRQIVTLTYPHIGNTGVNPEDVESNKIHAAGLIIRDLPLQVSNFRATQSLSDYLKAENIVAIAGIDTRKLTRLLREKGAQSGAIVAGADATGTVIITGNSGFFLILKVNDFNLSVNSFDFNIFMSSFCIDCAAACIDCVDGFGLYNDFIL
jgi:carbamoyl-phosphate synthase small subunit